MGKRCQEKNEKIDKMDNNICYINAPVINKNKKQVIMRQSKQSRPAVYRVL
jgi:hypothetical protein